MSLERLHFLSLERPHFSPSGFFKCGALGRRTLTCAVSFDIHMFGVAFVIAVIHTLYRFTVNADRPARVFQRTAVSVVPLLGKTLTAGIRAAVRMGAAYHDIAFAAAPLLIVRTVFNSAF